MPPLRAPKGAVRRGHRVWPWAVAFAWLALLSYPQLRRTRARAAPTSVALAEPAAPAPRTSAEGAPPTEAQPPVATPVGSGGQEDAGDTVLHQAPRVRGRVREMDGGAAPGALVTCAGCRGEADGEPHATTRADGDGRFTLAITGAYGVVVRLLAIQDGRVGWAEGGRVGEEALLTLAPPATVGGRVARPDGRGAPGVAVVFSEPLLEPLVLVTGDDGRFSGDVPPGLYQVTLRPDTSRTPRTWTVQVPAERPLQLATGAAR